eukprot:scaffold130598_cov17-Prasinocladus_malaysianus.AAC.1
MPHDRRSRPDQAWPGYEYEYDSSIVPDPIRTRTTRTVLGPFAIVPVIIRLQSHYYISTNTSTTHMDRAI